MEMYLNLLCLLQLDSLMGVKFLEFLIGLVHNSQQISPVI